MAPAAFFPLGVPTPTTCPSPGAAPRSTTGPTPSLGFGPLPGGVVSLLGPLGHLGSRFFGISAQK